MRKTLPGTENVKCDTRVCSTLGNKEIPGTKGIMIGLNMYTKN
jgi:hypothetical protein